MFQPTWNHSWFHHICKSNEWDSLRCISDSHFQKYVEKFFQFMIWKCFVSNMCHSILHCIDCVIFLILLMIRKIINNPSRKFIADNLLLPLYHERWGNQNKRHVREMLDRELYKKVNLDLNRSYINRKGIVWFQKKSYCRRGNHESFREN